MKSRMGMVAGLIMAAAIGLAPDPAQVHCDSLDGPVAVAVLKVLGTKNVNLILPSAPADAEEEMKGAFDQAIVVRANGAEAKALADRYFIETAVRLHRAGEGAAYTGLRPAGREFGPAIPGAEKALASGEVEALMQLVINQAQHGIAEHFAHV